MENAIVEYLDYQIPVTQLNGDKQQSGYSQYLDYQIPVTQLNGDMQAAKRD